MTRVLGQPDSWPNADTFGERRTIASIEMLDEIELEALISRSTGDALKKPRAHGYWVRLWIQARRPGPADDGRLTLPSRCQAKLGQSQHVTESCMLRRNFNASPLIRLLQASVLIVFATGMLVLAIHTENSTSRIATELTGSNVIVAP